MFHLTTALDAASGVPLYEQLYESLAAEMRSGAIPAGTRMPGKRRLAAELSVSVNTVDAAYQILATEGYMEPRERSGFYVQEYLALPTRPEEVPPPVSAAPPEAAEPPVRFDLSTRGVDPGLFPFRTWARLQKELLYSSPQLLTHGDAQGDVELRQALADYLEEYRGVRCTAEQVVVGAGMEYLLSLLAPLLPGKTAVENPGYQRAKQVLENNGVACCCLPVDADGLSVEALSGSGAAVCYVTPSHQFPTGVTMPAGRRTELLHWASRCPGQRYIIEDDYDSEFRFDTRPLPGKTAVENPGYQRAKQVLENNGVACCCLPVDADGLSVEALSGSGAAVCYVTPSHQFPTGVTMPAGRRTELLHWASRCPGQRYIIEDDYDSEFRFDTRPLPSLQGMAGADGPVVYLSTCSRSLAPGIRIAYMVLPRQLLPAWRAKYRIYSCTVSRFEQQTLARFIREGYFTRHLARERVAYKARRDALAASLRTAFAPDKLTLTGLHTGLHLLARLKNAPPDAALHAAAKAQGVALSLLSDYDLTGGEQDFSGTFVLGYGSLSEASFPEAGETLRKVCTAAREASVTV